MLFALLLTFLTLLWALRAIFRFSILFPLLLNVCPLFVWALRAVLFSCVLCPAVNDLPFFVGLAAYNLVWFVIHPASNVCALFT